MAKPKPILRTRTVSTKVTEEEFAELEAQAAKRGVNLSEWVRGALLERLKPEEVPGNESLLAEVMALRTIVINLASALARGQALSQAGGPMYAGVLLRVAHARFVSVGDPSPTRSNSG